MSEYTKRFVETLPSGELPALPELDVDDLRFALRVIGQYRFSPRKGFLIDFTNGIILRDGAGFFVASGWDRAARALFETEQRSSEASASALLD